MQSVVSTAFSRLNPLEESDWDDRLSLLPRAGFFHTQAWARVLNATYGYQPYYLVSPATGPLRTLLPLMEVDSWVTGRRGISLPFTDAVGPLGCDINSFRELWSAARALAEERRWKYLECRGGGKWLTDALPSTTFFGHLLPLSNDESALFSGCHDSVQRAIRKAERGPLTIEFSQSKSSMQDFYHLLCLTRRRHGVPPQPFRFFANIQEHILAKNHGWIVLARVGSQPVAAAIFFQHGKSALYKFGASDEAQQHLRANHLVMWRAIQHFARECFTTLDFGRSSLDNAGLRQFKLSWGAQEETIDYLRYDCAKSEFVTIPDEASGWHNRLFRALPLPLAQLAGRLLYRHVA